MAPAPGTPSTGTSGPLATSVTVARPPGVAATAAEDTVLVAAVTTQHTSGLAADWTMPADWTETIAYTGGGSDQMVIGHATYAAGATVPADWTFAADVDGDFAGVVTPITGADISAPIDATSPSFSAAAGSTVTIPGLTTTVDDCLILAGVGYERAVTVAFDAPLVLVGQVSSDTASAADETTSAVASQTAATAGAVADGTATGHDRDWRAVMVAISPAGAVIPEGGSTASVTVAATGAGAASTSGGSTASVAATAEAGGAATLSGGATPAIAAAATGAGTPTITAGATATVTATALGDGAVGDDHSGGATATVTALPAGAATIAVADGATATVTVTASGGTSQPTTWPDIVALLVAYLTPLTASAHVGSRVPHPRPDRFVQIRRVGGSPLPPVRDQARVDVWCWAPTDPDAMALALDVRAAVWALSGTALLGPVTYSVGEFLSPRQDDDELTGLPRVWTTYTLAIRADGVIQPAASVA